MPNCAVFNRVVFVPQGLSALRWKLMLLEKGYARCSH